MNISLAIATHNEEDNIGPCIDSCKDLVGEIVVVDGGSTDRTAQIAREKGAHVIVTENLPMFHINKQKAMDACTGEWVLQLDADERVTPELAGEIRRVVHMGNRQIEEYQKEMAERELFLRHQEVVHHSPDTAAPALSYNGFFIPRLNYFLGTYLRHGGVYPDGVIRLVKKGKAHLPCKSVHELMKVEGVTGWLQYPLLHLDSPNFGRYLERNNRYIDHMVADMKKLNIQKSLFNFLDYCLVKPASWFFMTTFRHKGILDGWQGVIFSFYSALRFPKAYMRYAKSS